MGCFVGIQFPQDYVGVVNEVSFFLDDFDSEKIIDELIIEASSDNFASVEELAIVSVEVHEGWNYYNVEDLSPKYQYYRLRSNRAGANGCSAISEIHFFGFEVIDDDNESYDCPVDLIKFVEDPLLQVIEEQKTSL